MILEHQNVRDIVVEWTHMRVLPAEVMRLTLIMPSLVQVEVVELVNGMRVLEVVSAVNGIVKYTPYRRVGRK